MSAEPVHHSDPTRLSAMLAPDLPATPWEPGELAAVLRHQLAAPLDLTPPGAEDAGDRPRPKTADVVPALPGLPQTFAELLFAPNPPIDLLIQLKAFAKPFVTSAKGALPREIAAVLYYGAIILGRTRCGRRISELDDASLRYGLEGMVNCDWLDSSTRHLMQEGLRSLTAHEPTSGVDPL
ncbi:MAG TPA: hypothetical protein VGI81_27110 [Tepidisphaeraceae bacterium]